jgi:hypothetical protein
MNHAILLRRSSTSMISALIDALRVFMSFLSLKAVFGIDLSVCSQPLQPWRVGLNPSLASQR